jgi:hypothetical protein
MSDLTPTEQPLKGPIDDAGDGQVVAETSARQGRRGLHMFVVLAISTALAVIVMFGIWSIQAGKMNAAAHASGASKAAASQSFDAGPSQPKAAANTPNP